MIDTIVRALNKWLEENHYTKNGWFIGRQYEENTQFNAYKTLIAEIYYHTGNTNKLILKQKHTVNKTTAIDNHKDNLYIFLLNAIFLQLDEIEKTIKDVEQMSDVV